MNSMRKVFVVSIAVVLAAFALPGVAGDNGKKLYSLNMEIVSAPPASPPFTVKATVKNEGNSTVNSFRLSVAGLTVVGVTQPASGNATFTASSVSVKNMRTLKSGESLAVTIGVNSCGDGVWSATVWSGSSLNGQTFDLVPGHSQLATSISCGSLAAGVEDFSVPDSLHPGCVTVSRGYYDKDGSVPGSGLPIYVTNTVFTNDRLHFRWPDFETGGDPLATFEYTVCAPGPLPEVPNTQVAWLNTDGSPASAPGNPAFIPAQNCLAPDALPAPYGTLVAGEGGVAASDTTITVNALSPSGAHGSIGHALPPFDIVIGAERMTVTAVSSDEGQAGDLSDPNERSEGESEIEVWTVTRAVGNTTAAAHTGGSLVMSTPLPLLPTEPAPPFPYIGGSPALMCVADQFNEESGGHATTLIDIGGDGHVGGP